MIRLSINISNGGSDFKPSDIAARPLIQILIQIFMNFPKLSK